MILGRDRKGWQERQAWKEGERVTADINMYCGNCYYCSQGIT